MMMEYETEMKPRDLMEEINRANSSAEVVSVEEIMMGTETRPF